MIEPEKSRKASDLSFRLPPQNIEAEKGVIGSVLLDNDLLHEVVPMLKSSDFYRSEHVTIWDAVKKLYEDGGAVDCILLADELTRRGELDKIGGDTTLAEIFESVPHAANGLHYAQIVVQKAILREGIDTANLILREAYSGERTAEEFVDVVQREAFKVGDRQNSDATVSAGSAVDQAYERLGRRKRGTSGVPTGLARLDAYTDGFQPGQLVILAARPSMGKTAIALNILEYATLAASVPALMVSLEMTTTELGERMIVARSGVSNHKFKDPSLLTVQEKGQIAQAMSEWQDSQAYIDDGHARTVLDILSNARRMKAKHNIGLLLIDYLQLIIPSEGANRQEQVAAISRGLKALARELKIPVVCLSQLNRLTETREEKRPRMADLRESGAIENDADLILLLHRPDYYDPNDKPGYAEFIVAKNRNGATGSVDLQFLRHVGRFEDFPDRGYANPEPLVADF